MKFSLLFLSVGALFGFFYGKRMDNITFIKQDLPYRFFYSISSGFFAFLFGAICDVYFGVYSI